MEHVKKMKVTPEICSAIRVAYDSNDKRSATKEIAAAFNLSESTVSSIKRSAYDFETYLSTVSPTYKRLGADSVDLNRIEGNKAVVNVSFKRSNSGFVTNLLSFLVGISLTLAVLAVLDSIGGAR